MSWERSETLSIYKTPDFQSTGHIAGFDLDWTLIRPVFELIPQARNDFALLPNRVQILKDLIRRGFSIVIFTNQSVTLRRRREDLEEKMENAVKALEVPIILMMATGKDQFRKPGVGMWNILNNIYAIQSGFFCGDMAGRPADKSDSDLKFAQGAGIPFYYPEQLFPSVERLSKGDPDPVNTVNIIVLPPSKSLIVMVGMPGSGKSTYINQTLIPLGYMVHTRGRMTEKKFFDGLAAEMRFDHNIVIDATNPAQTKREKYYTLARTYGYKVTVLYFVRDGAKFNRLRPEPVPNVAYGVYFKNLVEPTTANTPGDLYQIA